jgi:hypothetical protein
LCGKKARANLDQDPKLTHVSDALGYLMRPAGRPLHAWLDRAGWIATGLRVPDFDHAIRYAACAAISQTWALPGVG